MDPERWQVIQDLFDQALERDSEDRAAFLRQATAGDGDLLREVQSLLASDASASHLIDDALSDGLELFFEREAESPTSGRFGKYNILEKIGQGGFGTVYRGHDPQLQRAVAIKTCTAQDPSVRQRFVREARIAAGLQHPNIVTVHDFGEENGLPYLVQELLDGEDLDRRIERRETVPMATAQRYLLQIAQGLAYAHDRQVLHRDIKPENIRVLPGDRIKILDFGIACLVSEQRRLTGEHRTIGTVGYMAPEQLQGRDLDERSDIFAFGVLAYQLVGLRRPFEGKAFADISQRILQDEPTSLRTLRASTPPSLASLIHRCLAKEPDERPASFRQVADQLAELDGRSDGGGIQGVRWPVWMAAGSAAVAAAAIWALLVLSLPERAMESPRPSEGASGAEIAAADVPHSDGIDLGNRGASDPNHLAHSDAPKEPPPTPIQAKPEPAALTPAEQVGRPEPPESQRVSRSEPSSPQGGAASAQAVHGLELSQSAEVPSADVLSADPPPTNPVGTASSTAQEEVSPGAGGKITSPTTPADASAPGAQLATQPMEGPPEPILVRRVEPTYPALARRRGVEGEVRVAVLVDASGGIQQTAVTFSSVLDLGFEAAALEAARKATFQPAEMGGQAVQAWIELTYTFRLQ